ncbi:MAG: hypothetical protein WEA56_14365 [Balneolaceae bacterium]
MKLQHLFRITACLLFLGACSNTRTATAPEINNTLSIDGNLSDWNTGESIVENTETVNYYAAHDNDFLYLFIDIKSPFKENSIQRSGLVIYLNHSKETRKRIGIGFPSGSFNLLREDPGAFNSLQNDSDWLGKPGNQELLSELAKENFERVIIVERADGKSNPEYGFADRSQIEIDGFAISTNEDSRLTSIEMRIPLDGSSIFGIRKENVWLGFSVDPPDFRINEQQYDVSGRSQNNRYGNRRRPPSASEQRRALSRNLGEYERWYRLNLD